MDRVDIPLLEISKLSKSYRGDDEPALVDFSLTIPRNPPVFIAIAGESGSGKTTLTNLLLGLIRPTNGTVFYKGEDTSLMRRRERLAFRYEVQPILQDPYDVYNPFYKVDHVFNIVIRKFRLAERHDQSMYMINLSLEAVGLRSQDILGKYPHELSGGQLQRIMVARALMLKPRIIIADEPVSMIDAPQRREILEILLSLKEEYGVSMIYITHDLSTAYQMSDEIIILYRGIVVERGSINRVIEQPGHPYTKMLIDSIPEPDPDLLWNYERQSVATLQRQTPGCGFAFQCPHVMNSCLITKPPMSKIGEEQFVACYSPLTRAGHNLKT